MLAAEGLGAGSGVGDVPVRADVGDAASVADVGDAASRADIGLAVDAGYDIEPCTSLCNAVTPSYLSIGQGQGMGDLTTTGPRSVVVRITDRCADEFCGMDLGGLAPAQIMSDGFGRYRGIWRFVSCAGHPEVSDGPPSFNVLGGSNPYWALVQVRNPPWPVAAIDWQRDGGDESRLVVPSTKRPALRTAPTRRRSRSTRR